ncbi:hypothetical protein FI667_g830, partial [Globisporangium splendens]
MAEYGASRSSYSTSTSSASTGTSGSRLLSPVSKYNKLRETERLAQLERLKSVRVDKSAPSKRKADEAVGESAADAADSENTAQVSFAAASVVVSTAAVSGKKKQRRSLGRTSLDSNDGERVTGILKKSEGACADTRRHRATTSGARTDRYLTYDSVKEMLATSSSASLAPSRGVQFQGKESDGRAIEMFSRAVDSSFERTMPSYHSTAAKKPRLKHFDSLAVTKNKFAREREDEEDGVGDCGKLLPKRSARLVTSVKDEDVVDLEHVEDVSKLETVEGDEILQALMNTSTPRKDRKFAMESSRTASDERDRAFLRRRRLALQKYSAVPDEKEQENDKWQYRESATGTIVIERKKNATKKTAAVMEQDGPEQELAAASPETAAKPVATPPSIEEESDDGDKESTESKIARLSQAKDVGWRHYVLWVLAGSIMLCTLVIAFPSFKVLFQPVVPFCDSNHEESYSIVSLQDFDYTKALQPYSGDATTGSCRACPLFGNCSSGGLQSCVPPYELSNGVCVESTEVRQDLHHLASLIQHFIITKAAEDIWNTTLWGSLFGGEHGVSQDAFTAPIKVFLSDIQDLLADTIAYGKAVTSLPRQYVLNRAMDLALRDLKDIFVGEKDQILVGRSILPWSYQARHQLYANARLILFVIVLTALLGLAYRNMMVNRTERGLIDRLVKEVRFALLKRTAHSDKAYPADHLRDDLFDILPNISPRDRKWLRESVWPRVAALVEEDSRVRSRTTAISGNKMVVWEWISAAPTNASTLQGAKQALLSKPTVRRKKGSRKSFPM